MRHFVFNLALVSCSLFVFSITADAHPHKLGEMNHGPSLESYQIELDFSAKRMMPDRSTSNIKLADKNKGDKKVIAKKPNKNKTMQKNQQIRKQQKEHRN
jgi:ABC-type uncharacterized transport system substrate-binding protein